MVSRTAKIVFMAPEFKQAIIVFAEIGPNPNAWVRIPEGAKRMAVLDCLKSEV